MTAAVPQQAANPGPLYLSLAAMVLASHDRSVRCENRVDALFGYMEAILTERGIRVRPKLSLAYSASRADCPGSVLPLTRGRATGRAS